MTDSYVALDVETTGLNGKRDKIIEIGALKVVRGELNAAFQTFVNPGRPLEDSIIQLTGITDEMVADSPQIGQVIGELMDFCRELPLLGHQILFDYRFLKRAAVNQKLEWEREGIDTLVLCRKFMPAEEKKTLTDACRFYQIDTGASHRALPDATAAHFLYQALAKRYEAKEPLCFQAKKLVCQVKREQPASKRQKERLQELLNYHKIEAPVEIQWLTRNEASRLTDKILSQYGRKRDKGVKSHDEFSG